MATTMRSMSREKKGMELKITRLLRAPPQAVWRAWTDPNMIVHWWGPAHFTSPIAKVDLKVGGRYLYSMRDWTGKDYWSAGVFKEIEEPRRLRLTDFFSDPSGNPVPASYYGMKGEFPMEMDVEITFEEVEGGTELRLRQKGFPDEENLKGAEMGWNTSLDKLEGVLMGTRMHGKSMFYAIPGKQEMGVMTLFDAPKERLYKAYTDPAQIPKRWGPSRLKIKIEKYDARAGGSWRIIQTDEKGNEYAFHGVYHEAVPSELLVLTFEYEGTPGHVCLQTVTFTDKGGSTEVKDQLVFQSAEDRDGMMRASGDEGMEGPDRLAKLVERK